MPQTLILTLKHDNSSQAVYEELRQRLFPPERNQIAAHLALFHQHPDNDFIHQSVRDAALSTHGFALSHPTPRSIGKGVAIFFQSPALLDLHAALSEAFTAHLIPQDRQRFRAHIVLQNKVVPEVARQTLLQLQSFAFPEPRAVGMTLWRYLGGPWERLADYPFSADLS